jgi:hypothetical protein
LSADDWRCRRLPSTRRLPTPFYAMWAWRSARWNVPQMFAYLSADCLGQSRFAHSRQRAHARFSTHCGLAAAIATLQLMELHGTLANNLTSAVQSARRLRGHPVHGDTIRHWTDLLHHARRELSAGSGEPVHALIIELEKELADRAA